jgi:hypothetical protein
MPPRAAGLPVGHIFVIQISKLADGGHTFHAEAPDFSGW